MTKYSSFFFIFTVMTQIEQMSDEQIKVLVNAYLSGSLTILMPSKPLKGNKEGSIMEQIFFEFESRKL